MLLYVITCTEVSVPILQSSIMFQQEGNRALPSSNSRISPSSFHKIYEAAVAIKLKTAGVHSVTVHDCTLKLQNQFSHDSHLSDVN